MKHPVRVKFSSISIFTLVFVLFASSAVANQLYRYKDESGSVVLGRSIPPELVKNGYDILNSQGRLIEKVAPALTKEQIVARDAELERQKRQAEAEAKQLKIDNELKQLYSHPNDAVRILDRKVSDIKGVIAFQKGQIESARKEIQTQESKAAELQRNGRAIPKRLTDKLVTLKKEIVQSETEIEELQQSMASVLTEFDGKIKRLEVITNKPATDYPALLERLNPAEAETKVQSES